MVFALASYGFRLGFLLFLRWLPMAVALASYDFRPGLLWFSPLRPMVRALALIACFACLIGLFALLACLL